MTIWEPCTDPEHADVTALFGPLTSDLIDAIRAQIGAYEQRRPGPYSRRPKPSALVRTKPARFLALLSDGHVRTSAEIGAALGISVNAVRKAVFQARQRGVSIEQERGAGYRLRGAA